MGSGEDAIFAPLQADGAKNQEPRSIQCSTPILSYSPLHDSEEAGGWRVQHI